MKLYNVLDYGFTPDGKTDNIEMFKKLWKEIEPRSTIYFPTGEYLVSESLIINKFINIKGDGWNSKIIKNSNFSDNGILSVSSPSKSIDPADSIRISDILLDASVPTEGEIETDGIVIDGGNNLFFDNIGITNQSGNGIAFKNNSLNNTVEISKCYIRKCQKSGINISSFSSDIHINECDIGYNTLSNVILAGTSSTIKNSTVWGSTTDCGLVINGKSNHISNCQFEGNARHAILLYDASHSSITSCKIYSSLFAGAYGIYLTKTDEQIIENVLISGNMIYSSLSETYNPFKNAIFVDQDHKSIKVFDNSISYLGIGSEDKSKRPYVEGLSLFKGDSWNNINDPLFINAQLSSNVELSNNVITPLLFDNILNDISQISKDGYLLIREDGIYTLSGTIQLLTTNISNSSKLSVFIDGLPDSTIHYFPADTPEIIGFSKTLILKSETKVTLSMVTIGEKLILSSNSNINVCKLN